MKKFHIYYKEIKNRILLIIISWIYSVLICSQYVDTLIYIYIKPSQDYIDKKNIYFIYTNINELFYTYINLIIYSVNLITIVYIIYQVFYFIRPGLYNIEYNSVLFYLKTLAAVWLLNIILLYNILIPFSWEFFISFQNTIEKGRLEFFFESKLNEYLSFILNLYNLSIINIIMIYFIFLYTYSVQNINTYLKSKRKIFYFLFFLLASLVTPPDVLNLIILGTTSILIYEIFIMFVILVKNIKVTN